MCLCFSVMWSKLLMTSAISCPLWSSVYECERVGCTFHISGEGLSVVYLSCTVCSVVCPCQLFSSAWIRCLEEVYNCKCDMFSVVNVSP